ncbi:unknown [Crocosphaera subtropica ATCC 51142]|uniref:DUF1822 family protein n=1 Tax=Crocosphaera subtropica (strain ATCC 51142 / BH68) TaxID=43989 RepID=B1X1H8_CROS5|nr:DUF1822 family protein [Crocosphaera subtropica]ACB51407.1 unknown [Crocosphaera subtropica ATCC 51142]
MTFLFAQPNQLWLELSETNLSQAWQQSHICSSATTRWRAYLNRLSLTCFLSYVQEEWSYRMTSWPEDPLTNLWELVEGSTLILGNKRIVLLPTEAMDEDELRVPQEWIDIPEWVADYYLAAQVNLDEQWLNIWGYTTHQKLKEIGHYNSSDRTYSLEKPFLFQDINAFWVSQELALEEVTQGEILPLTPLSSVQAENLIERLGNAELKEPRLAVPFTLWGSLLANSSWRQQLSQHRQGNTQPNVLVNLSSWFDNLFESSWQAPETLNLAFSSRRNTTANTQTIQRANLITLGREQVILLVELTPEEDGRIAISLQLFPPSNRRYLPEMIQLTLLSETGEVLRSVQSRTQDNAIRIPRFKCATGFRFRLQITLNEHCITEDFIV